MRVLQLPGQGGALQVAQGLSALQEGRDARSQGEHPNRPHSATKSPTFSPQITHPGLWLKGAPKLGANASPQKFLLLWSNRKAQGGRIEGQFGKISHVATGRGKDHQFKDPICSASCLQPISGKVWPPLAPFFPSEHEVQEVGECFQQDWIWCGSSLHRSRGEARRRISRCNTLTHFHAFVQRWHRCGALPAHLAAQHEGWLEVNVRPELSGSWGHAGHYENAISPSGQQDFAFCCHQR